jgi:hypothetical protein
VEDIRNISRKENYDVLVIFVVIFTWFRFFSFFLVIKGVSRHFITIYRMIKQTMAFIFVVLCYMTFQAIIFMLLFKEYNTDNYRTLPLSMRNMGDFMNGSYDRDELYGNENNIHTVLSIFHLLMSKILLVNYIIAMLMTVYNSMKEKGDFTYKSNRYEYIERYQIALRDSWGYSELVTTPAPLNLTMVLTLPWLGNKAMFMKLADLIGKVLFWLENIIYILLLIIYFSMLIPIIYVKFIIGIYKNLPI